MADQNFNRREVIGATAAAISAALVGRDSDAGEASGLPELAIANQRKIEVALAALLQRPNNEDAYVIFEEKISRKFVQFARPAHKSLILDLPSQTLDDIETTRANVYFGELGIKAVDEPVFDGPGGEVVGRQRTIQMMFDRDYSTAARVASEVFRRIFRFPPTFELVIKEI
jgi:hypothetical protein